MKLIFYGQLTSQSSLYVELQNVSGAVKSVLRHGGN